MKQNRILLATILAMFVLAVLPVISAATMSPVIYAPLNNTNHTREVFVNCNTTHTNVTNVTAYYNTSAGVMTELGALTNVTHNNWTGTLTLTSANDGIYNNISCYADNGTDQEYSAEVGCTGIMFDSTDPVCSLVRQSGTIEWKDTQLITWSASDTRALKSTAVYIDRPEDGSTLPYTDTSRALTLTSQDTKYVGDWTVNITGTDTTGNTCTETVAFTSTYGDGEIWEPSEPPVDTGKNLLLLIILGIVLWVIFGKKK